MNAARTGDEFRVIAERPDGGEATVLSIPAPRILTLGTDKVLQAWPFEDGHYTDAIAVVEPVYRARQIQGLDHLRFRSLKPPFWFRLDSVPATAAFQATPASEITAPIAGLKCFVRIYRYAPVAPATAAVSCALCNAAIAPGSRRYRCLCGAELCVGADADARTCATMKADATGGGRCPRCAEPIALLPGYATPLPEHLNVPNT